MPEKPKRSTGQAKRQEHQPSPRLPKGTSERRGSEGAKGGCRRPAAPRRSRGASLPQESGVPGGLPQGEGDSVRVRPRRGCKASTRTTNPARSAKDATEQTSATRPGAKAQPGAEGRKNRLALYVPLMLLLSFLAGYLATGLLGSPGLVTAFILFGGSVFVLIILSIMYYIVDQVAENERQLFEAREAGKAKTAFFFNMSHDLRTPMNAILGYTQLARNPGTTEGQMRAYLDKIHASGQHLLALINDVLEMSRIENGKLELNPGPTDLRAVLREAEDLFTEQMREKQLRFLVRQELRHSCVLCDKSRLNRVLLNLLSNALKFTPAGGEVELSLVQTGGDETVGRYELKVRDTGIGMSEEFAEKVFEAFERERSSTVSGIQGTGLGMAITKSLVELMGGSIRLETARNEGSTFIILLDLPLLPETKDADGETGACPCESSPRPDTAGHRLLLAEDNSINREIATLILSEIGFTLDTAENGREALELLQKAGSGVYSAVLMDVQMPEMDGYEATRAIRALPDPALASIPVIAMTANAFSEDVQAEREAGMNAHISKPLDVREMIQTLIQVLNLKTK